jgi:uncharacterized protein
MRFNVSGLLLEGTGATRDYELDSVLESPGHEPERVKGALEFLRTPTGVLVRAHLSLVEPENCSRCLRPLDEPVDIGFEEEFVSLVDPRTGHAIPNEDVTADTFLITDKHILDLSEAVRQYREVSLLMKPLCRPDCRGLCAVCGKDLNEGACGHEVAPADSRWEGLAVLKELADQDAALLRKDQS